MGDKITAGPVEVDVDEIVKETRNGFDVQARLNGRGLRTAKITLFLDEVLGDELGDARDAFDANKVYLGRVQEGVLGEIDAAQMQKREQIERMKVIFTADAAAAFAAKHKKDDEPPIFNPDDVEFPEFDTTAIDAKIAELEAKRDEIIERLTQTALVVTMRAVPPIIQDDCNRLTNQSIKKFKKDKNFGWDELEPNEKRDLTQKYSTAHLMTKLFQTVTDNETGSVNTTTTLADALAYIDLLPPSQMYRLDFAMGKLQLKDAISRSLEGQEDFS